MTATLKTTVGEVINTKGSWMALSRVPKTGRVALVFSLYVKKHLIDIFDAGEAFTTDLFKRLAPPQEGGMLTINEKDNPEQYAEFQRLQKEYNEQPLELPLLDITVDQLMTSIESQEDTIKLMNQRDPQNPIFINEGVIMPLLDFFKTEEPEKAA